MSWHAVDCTRVYVLHGKIAHLLPPGERPGVGYSRALCARSPALFGVWLGTGSQSEYDRAASLPLCSRCEQKVTPQ